MNTGREIVSCALREGTLQPFLDAGINRAWLSSTTDLSRSAIFEGEDLNAYQSILKHYEQHAKLPSLDIFRRSFPEVSYRLPDSGHTSGELVEILQQERSRILTRYAVADVFEVMDEEKYDEAMQLLSAHQAALGSLRAAGSLPLLSLDDLDDLPDPEPLIDGTLDGRTVTMLSGPSGKGKSFVALDWALSLASGAAWLDRPAKRKRVLYVAAEGAHGQKWRVRAWRDAHRDALPDSHIRFIARAVQFGSPDELQDLLAAARNFDVVILDTLAKITIGMEENSARDMSLFVDALYKLRDALADGDGGTVILIHHTGYNTARARGSSAIQAGVDNAISIDAEDPHDDMNIMCAKRKDGAPFEDIHARLVECGPSAIVEEIECPIESAQKFGDRAQALTDHLSRNKWTNVRDVAEALGMSKSALDRLLKDVASQGRVVKMPGGKYEIPSADTPERGAGWDR